MVTSLLIKGELLLNIYIADVTIYYYLEDQRFYDSKGGKYNNIQMTVAV